MRKKIILTVTNDLVFDRRMHRICQSLHTEYVVELVGRYLDTSSALDTKPYLQTRLRCIFNKGFLFYAEYNIRLFFYLLRFPFDTVCGCDLDTLPAAVFAGKLKMKKIVYDAHEYFPESPELVNRKFVKKCWAMIEKMFVPRCDKQYTVCASIAAIFTKYYKNECQVIRNVPPYAYTENPQAIHSSVLLYQGAVNVGRGILETINAMKLLPDFKLYIAGDGDILQKLRQYVNEQKWQDQIRFLGNIKPAQLTQVTQQAFAGINLLENLGLSYYYSLGNKTFDYIQSSIPQILISFPEYERLNNEFEIGILLNDLKPETIANAVNYLKQNPDKYKQLQENCGKASELLCWENEEQKLLNLYKELH